MKATEQHFAEVLFTALYKVVLGCESVEGIFKCDNSNEIYLAVLFCGAVYYPVPDGLNFGPLDEILNRSSSVICYRSGA